MAHAMSKTSGLRFPLFNTTKLVSAVNEMPPHSIIESPENKVVLSYILPLKPPLRHTNRELNS